MTEVRSLQSALIPDAEDWEYYELSFLRGIAYMTAKASTTEEPREGKLHAGICTGDAG